MGNTVFLQTNVANVAEVIGDQSYYTPEETNLNSNHCNSTRYISHRRKL